MTAVSEPAPVSARLERPQGLVDICDVLKYLRQDYYDPSLREAAEYAGMKPRMLGRILPPELRVRLSSKKVLVRRSELDSFLDRFRERPQKDLQEIVDGALEAIRK